MPLELLPPLPDPPPEVQAVTEEWMAYVTGKKRLRFAHAVLTLCRFGRWLSWALAPWFSFFDEWTKAKEGEISTEEKARLSLRKPISYWEATIMMALPVTAAMVTGIHRVGRKRGCYGR
jgi:hypothetical protein